MRIVLDTGVLVSATLIPQGIFAKVLDAWRDQDYELLLSPSISKEIADTIKQPHLRERHGWSDEEVDDFLEGLELFGRMTPGELTVTELEADPDDDKYLACAVEGAADYVVSRNALLQDLIAYHDIPIITPHQFWELLSNDTK